MNDSFATNQSGSMTPEQRRFLLSWNMGYGLFHLVIAGCLFAGFWQNSPLLAFVSAIALAAIGLYQIIPVVLDVLEGRPRLISGFITKSQDQVRGPIHYVVEIGKRRLRVRKSAWARLTEGAPYKIYYTMRSNWVLSWAQIDSADQSLSEIEVVVNAVEQDVEYQAARERQIAILERGYDWGSQGKSVWTRDELHDR